MHFYELQDNFEHIDRWYLGDLFDAEGTRLDDRDFTYGIPVFLGPPLRVHLWNDKHVAAAIPPLRYSLCKERHGRKVDFTYSNCDVPVVTRRVADIIGKVAGADIQRIPVQVEGETEPYEIVNVISVVACLKRDECEARWWTDADGRPEKLGGAKLVTKMVIDRDRVGSHNLIRPSEWDLAIVASEAVKEMLEQSHVSGIRFVEVT